MKKTRIRKLAKYDWIERMTWIKQISFIQYLAPQDVNNEFD